MRRFRIYADEGNLQPHFRNWYAQIDPGSSPTQIYEELREMNNFQVELFGGFPFMDIISYPCFMVTKEFANLIRLYCPDTAFKYAVLYDVKSHRSELFQIPILPELLCLDGRSVLSRDKSEIVKGILQKDKLGNVPIFRIGGVKGRYIAASLEFVESAYRREVRGMKIEEYMVE